MKLCVFLAIFGMLSINTTTNLRADDEPKVLFGEEFTSPINAGWYWLREDPQAWKVENGKLMLRSLPGGPPGFAEEKDDVQNMLLRKAPVTSKTLIIEFFVENRPELLYEHAALYWYYDDDDYVGLLKEWMGDEVKLRLMRKKNSESIFVGEPTYTAEGVWLRLVIKGDKTTGYFRSTEKEEWQKLGQVDLPSKDKPQIGFHAGCGPENGKRWARFSHFRILEQAE